MLSLFRASNISFPGEKVMDEAKTFTREYLNQVLTGEAVTDVDQSLLSEVKYALEFPWHCSVPRWEARSFIEIYKQNNPWLKYNINQKILELAKSMNLFDWLLHVQWERYLESYLQEAEWITTGFVPSLDEYLKNGQASSGMSVLNLIPLLLMGQILPDDILQQIFYPSKIHELLELTIRLKDDITDFELEKERGEIASSLECYLKEKPGSTREDALNHMNGILDLSFSELNRELLKHDNVPLCCKKLVFNLARGMHFLFKYKDFVSISNEEVKDQIVKVLVEQVPL